MNSASARHLQSVAVPTEPSAPARHSIVEPAYPAKPVESRHGGKEVHAADVAKAVALLLTAEGVAGQAYNCCDMYISDQEVAGIAKELTGSDSRIADLNPGPKHRIVTDKLRSLGMVFGGRALLEQTVRQMLASDRS